MPFLRCAAGALSLCGYVRNSLSNEAIASRGFFCADQHSPAQ